MPVQPAANVRGSLRPRTYPPYHRQTILRQSLDEDRFEPDERRHAVYTRLYDDVYRHLYPALQPYLHRLTQLTEQMAG